MFYMVFKCFSGVFVSVSDACFKCFIFLQKYVASIASGYLKVYRVLHLAPSSPLTALHRCLHLLSVPAGHPNQRRMRAPPPSSRCWWRGVGWKRGGGRATANGTGECSFSSVVPLRRRTDAPSITLFRGFIAEIGRLPWQVLDVS
jgi:hypothetical protein